MDRLFALIVKFIHWFGERVPLLRDGVHYVPPNPIDIPNHAAQPAAMIRILLVCFSPVASQPLARCSCTLGEHTSPAH